MKKLITILALLVILFPSLAFAAAGSFVVTTDTLIQNTMTGRMTQRVLTLTFLANSGTATIPSLTITNSTWTDGTTSGTFSRANYLTGWFLYQIEIDANHAGTEPSNDSDLYIKKNGVDILADNGVNQVDNDAERMVFCSDGSTSILGPLTDTIVISIENNAVNSGTGTIKLILIPGR